MSANRAVDTEYSLGDILAVPVIAGAQVYAGTIVVFDRGRGGACPARNERNLIMAGVATNDIDSRQKSTGQNSVAVRRRGRFLFNVLGHIDFNSLFRRVYAVDDTTVQLADSGPTGPWVGNVAAIDTRDMGNKVWIEIDAAVLEGNRQ